MLLTIMGSVVVAIWLGLGLCHASFWRVEVDPVPLAPEYWPAVTVIIPARNEAAVIGETLRSLWRQDYDGPLSVVVVDDHSEDATGEVAVQASDEMGRQADLYVLAAPPLPAGWTGKVWAMQHGYVCTEDDCHSDFVLFSDADISHGVSAVRELVCRAEAGPCDLVSFMVRLQCNSLPERLMIPAFVFFFKMLYPFRRSNSPTARLAAAAGGTMLVRRGALRRIDGLNSIANALIDDCSLARAVKAGGHRIWLGLSDSSVSTRQYQTLGEITEMIARTAYTQLDYSPLRLAGCVGGLTLTFLAPVALTLSLQGDGALLGGAAWLIMASLYLPMVRFYRQSPLWSLLLPVIALLYLRATVLSAWRYHRGYGGQWKGRRQAGP